MHYPFTHTWQENPSLKSLFLALSGSLDQSEDLVRFAGGCVRDLLTQRTPQDYDLATSLLPSEVMERLHQAGISFITPGLSHGTVTALLHSKSFEITTLRQDLAPDGRHTPVAYLKEWEHDALRRDFTINALYMDWKGQVYDYVGGLLDLENKRVQFVGDPETRIREDYLRLLRWFRMNACFGKDPPSNSLMNLFQIHAPCLKLLSRERKQEEFFKILKSPHVDQSLSSMRAANFLTYLCPFFRIPVFLKKCHSLQKKIKQDFDPCLILTSLLIHIPQEQLSEALSFLRLSKKQTQFITAVLAERNILLPTTNEVDLLKKAYFLEKAVFEALMLLKVSLNGHPTSFKASLKTLQELLTWGEEIRSRLIFPLTGKDLIKSGIHPGPQFGEILKATKVFWLETNPKPTKAQCLAFLKKKSVPSLDPLP